MKKQNWGKRLAEILKERKISQKEAASIAGVRPSVLSGWIAGMSPRDFDSLKVLSDHLQVSFTWLLTGAEEIKGQTPSVAEAFEDGGTLYDGYAKISIQRLVPRNKG